MVEKDESNQNKTKQLIEFLENFQIFDNDLQRVASEVMYLVDKVVMRYAEIEPLEVDQEVKKAVARRVLDLLQEVVDS
jgi:ribosomal protein L4